MRPRISIKLAAPARSESTHTSAGIKSYEKIGAILAPFHLTLFAIEPFASGAVRRCAGRTDRERRSICMRPEWTGLGLKFTAETVRDLFGEHDLLNHYCVALRRKIAAILEPVQTKPQVKVKPAPKAPRAETRIPAIERKIALGLQLLDLKSKATGHGRRIPS